MTTGDRPQLSGGGAIRWLVGAFRLHLLAYGALFLVWAIIYFLTPIAWNAFWLFVTWSILLLVHYMTVKSIVVDPQWASQRTLLISHNATDLSHITSIRERHDARQAGDPPAPDAGEQTD